MALVSLPVWSDVEATATIRLEPYHATTGNAYPLRLERQSHETRRRSR